MLIYHPPTWFLPEKEVQPGVVTRTKTKFDAMVNTKTLVILKLIQQYKSSVAPLYHSLVTSLALLHGV